MTEQTQDIKQEYRYQVDQQVSVNAFIDVDIAGEAVRFQVTNRYGATPEKIAKTLKASIDAYTLLRQDFPRMLITPPAAAKSNGNAPRYETPEGETPSFIAETMEITVKGDKTYCKIKGKPWSQFGVTVWPEVLQAAGFIEKHAEELDPRSPPNVAGWRCFYTTKEHNGKTVPEKITAMVPANASDEYPFD